MSQLEHDSGSDHDDNAGEKTLTKGPWSQAEDDLLLAYIEKHGDGNWNNVQRTSTLSRCGKSCRLRWVNHLRPDLKKGAFTDEEEKRVVELHAEMGNKWARMSAKLPGRTDNEIKNFWNTRVKRLQRLGLPLYPSEVQEKRMNAAAESGLNPDPLNAHSSQDLMDVDNDQFSIPVFELLPNNPFISDYQSMVPKFTTITPSFLGERPCFPQPDMYNSTPSPSEMAYLRQMPGVFQSDMYNSQSYPSGTAYLRQMSCVFQPDNMYSSTASPSGMAYLRPSPCVSQLNVYNSIASPSGTVLPFTGGESMDDQRLPLENYPSVESTLGHAPDIDVLVNTTYSSPSGTAITFAGGGSMDDQRLPLENYPFVESTLEHVPDIDLLVNAATYSSPSGTVCPFTGGGSMDQQRFPIDNNPFLVCDLVNVNKTNWIDDATYCSLLLESSFIDWDQEFELPSIQCGDSHEAAGTSEAQQCDPISELESNNTFVQPLLSDQTPSVDNMDHHSMMDCWNQLPIDQQGKDGQPKLIQGPH